jgi:hypothetical protein
MGPSESVFAHVSGAKFFAGTTQSAWTAWSSAYFFSGTHSQCVDDNAVNQAPRRPAHFAACARRPSRFARGTVMRIVFLAEGKLFLKEEDREPVEIESPFAVEAAERASARSERHAWKSGSDESSGPFTTRTVWGKQAGSNKDWHPAMRFVTRGAKPDELLYAQSMSASSGLFRYNLATREEYRLFHRQDFDACGLSCNPVTGQIVVATRGKEELGKLQLIDDAARRNDRITAGDGHDSNPSHDPAARTGVYFQSSGVGRNERGEIVALGPAAIHRLDQATGEMQTVLEDDGWDFLLPKADATGALHYIRRPYAAQNSLPLGQKVKAFVALPFHLAGAMFGFLDAFSRMFGKKSLRPAGGGPGVPVSRNRYATFLDTTVELERALEQQGRKGDEAQLVPKTWELVRRDSTGHETVLAQHVVAYDLGTKGEVVYSDGLRIWLAGPTPRKLHGGHVVQSVVVA